MMEKDRLSAFFDGEQECKSDEEIQWLSTLHQDTKNVQAWKCFSLIRDTMRDEAGVSSEQLGTDFAPELMRDKEQERVNWDICANIALALEAEPTHNKEIQQQETAATTTLLKEAQPTAIQAKRTLPSWLQQIAQIGTAAAVSLVVILGVQHYNAQQGVASQASNQQPPVLQTIPLSGEAAPVSLTRQAVLKPKNDEVRVIEQRQRINELFQDFELQRRLNAMDLEKVNEEESIE